MKTKFHEIIFNNIFLFYYKADYMKQIIDYFCSVKAATKV